MRNSEHLGLRPVLAVKNVAEWTVYHYSVSRSPEIIRTGVELKMGLGKQQMKGTDMKAFGMKLALCAMLAMVMVGCAGYGSGGGMSDEDTIQSIIDDAMAALQAGDIEAMVSAYDVDTFESDNGGVAGTKEFLEGAKEQGFLDDIEIDLSSLVITVDGDSATAKPVDLEGAFGALTLEFDLKKIGGVWKVTYQTQY